MPQVGILHTIGSSFAILGIGMVWYDFNKKVYERVSHLLNIMWCETAAEKETRWKKEREERRRRREQEEEKTRIEEEIKRLGDKKRIEEEEEKTD